MRVEGSLSLLTLVPLHVYRDCYGESYDNNIFSLLLLRKPYTHVHSDSLVYEKKNLRN